MRYCLLLISSILFLTGVAMASVPAPQIIPKDAWGSMKVGDFSGDYPFDPYCQGPIGDPLAITIHHSTIPLSTNPPNHEEDVKKVQAIQRYHAGKGWGDVGYHFVLGSDGSIYEGRPLPYQGTHAPPNQRNIGFCLMGDFQGKECPTELQLDTVIRLTTWLCDRWDIDPSSKITIFDQTNFAVCGHRDWNATDCPGDALYALIPNIREKIRAGLLANAPAYDSRVSAYQYLPQTLLVGHLYELPLSVRNTGYAAWTALNKVGLSRQSRDPVAGQPAANLLSVGDPLLKEGESIAPLSNKTWQVSINASSEGKAHVAFQMSQGDNRFGPELAWDVTMFPADAFISSWLVGGPFIAATPDAAYMADFFAGKPIDVLDIMDEASEKAHGYAVTGEYSSGERNYRGEDGERTKENGRYYRGEETFKVNLADFEGGQLVLRRLIDADTRDQEAVVYIDGRRFGVWRSRGMMQSRLWKDLDLLIPALTTRGKDSLDVRLKSVGTPQWGNSSFKYTVLDMCEPLVAPKAGDEFDSIRWKPWKSDAGLTDLSQVMPGVESGAVYLATYVKSPVTRYVQLRTGFGGNVKAWFNGEKVISGRSSNGAFPDALQGEILLKRGWNRLLVKVALEPGMKDLYVRICDREGEPLKGLKLGMEPVDEGKPEMLAKASK